MLSSVKMSPSENCMSQFSYKLNIELLPPALSQGPRCDGLSFDVPKLRSDFSSDLGTALSVFLCCCRATPVLPVQRTQLGQALSCPCTCRLTTMELATCLSVHSWLFAGRPSSRLGSASYARPVRAKPPVQCCFFETCFHVIISITNQDPWSKLLASLALCPMTWVPAVNHADYDQKRNAKEREIK